MMKKITWLSILQGFAVLLVVIGHIILTDIVRDPSHPVAAFSEKLVYKFHMPLFIFISGYLFSLTSINKNWKEVLKKKMIRLILPLFFFTTIAFFLKWLASSFVKRQVALSPMYYLNSFIYPQKGPLLEMWFLITLLVLFLLFPLYKWSLKNKYREFIFFAVVLLLQFIPLPQIEALCLTIVAKNLLFFYLGILSHQYGIIDKIKNNLYLLLSFIAFILFTVCYDVQLLTVLCGITFFVILSICIDKKCPMLFKSYRNYLMPIFLMGIFIQMAIRWFYVYIGNDCWYIPFWFISLLSGIYIPVFIAKLLQKYLAKYPLLLACFGL